jgi:nitrogen fixation/metabolism regulation signal transduction histidine kinase
MKAVPAKALDARALEDLGRATHRIVHDLKNQLNGLKLYATYLRKRLERDDRAAAERETIDKLVAGLDHAAKEMAALVRYAEPRDLRQQPHTDLRTIVHAAVHDPAYRVTGPLTGSLASDVHPPLIGAFDPHALAEAFSALSREALAGQTNNSNMSLHLERIESDQSPQAVIEWRGVAPQVGASQPGIHAAFARRIIEGHGGVVEFQSNTIKVTLPLSE